MNGFLVTARFFMDDIPLRLLPTREDANAYVNGWDDDKFMVDRSDLDHAIDVQGSDCSEFVCLAVTEFRDGRPVGEATIVPKP